MSRIGLNQRGLTGAEAVFHQQPPKSDFEKLRKGIVRPELQSELERFSRQIKQQHNQDYVADL